MARRVAGAVFANPWRRISGLERREAADFRAISLSQILMHLNEKTTKGSVVTQKKAALKTKAGSISATFSSEKPENWHVRPESEKLFLITANLVVCDAQVCS